MEMLTSGIAQHLLQMHHRQVRSCLHRGSLPKAKVGRQPTRSGGNQRTIKGHKLGLYQEGMKYHISHGWLRQDCNIGSIHVSLFQEVVLGLLRGVGMAAITLDLELVVKLEVELPHFVVKTKVCLFAILTHNNFMVVIQDVHNWE